MNKTQRKILLISAAIIALMVIFPPYQVKNYKEVTIMSGYAIIFSLPEYPTTSGSIPANVNAVTLFAEIFGALIVCGLAYVATKD